MRTRKKVAALVGAPVIAIVVSLTLAGCVQPQPPVIPTSASSSKPVFASDAEALAAAKKAFAVYLSASDAVGRSGGVEVDRLSSLDTAAQYARDKQTFSKLQNAGEHTSGDSSFSKFTLQDAGVSAKGLAEVAAYACIDISKTQLIDGSGNIINADRPSGAPLVVTFHSANSGSKTLLLDGSVTWQGQNFCS